MATSAPSYPLAATNAPSRCNEGEVKDAETSEELEWGYEAGAPKPMPCRDHGLLALLVPGLYAKKEALFVALAATGVEPAPGPWKANVRTALRSILDTSQPHTLERRTAKAAATALRAWEAARTHFKHTEELLDQGLLEGMTIVRAAYLEQLERVNEYHDELVDAVLNAPSPCSN